MCAMKPWSAPSPQDASFKHDRIPSVRYKQVFRRRTKGYEQRNRYQGMHPHLLNPFSNSAGDKPRDGSFSHFYQPLPAVTAPRCLFSYHRWGCRANSLAHVIVSLNKDHLAARIRKPALGWKRSVFIMFSTNPQRKK